MGLGAPGPARALQTVLVALARGRRDQLQAGTPSPILSGHSPFLTTALCFPSPPQHVSDLVQLFLVGTALAPSKPHLG